jgi:hypothetical protein
VECERQSKACEVKETVKEVGNSRKEAKTDSAIGRVAVAVKVHAGCPLRLPCLPFFRA